MSSYFGFMILLLIIFTFGQSQRILQREGYELNVSPNALTVPDNFKSNPFIVNYIWGYQSYGYENNEDDQVIIKTEIAEIIMSEIIAQQMGVNELEIHLQSRYFQGDEQLVQLIESLENYQFKFNLLNALKLDVVDSLYYDPYYLGRDKFDEIKSEDFEAYLKCEAFHYFKKLSNSDFVDLSDVDEIIQTWKASLNLDDDGEEDDQDNQENYEEESESPERLINFGGTIFEEVWYSVYKDPSSNDEAAKFTSYISQIPQTYEDMLQQLVDVIELREQEILNLEAEIEDQNDYYYLIYKKVIFKKYRDIINNEIQRIDEYESLSDEEKLKNYFTSLENLVNNKIDNFRVDAEKLILDKMQQEGNTMNSQELETLKQKVQNSVSNIIIEDKRIKIPLLLPDGYSYFFEVITTKNDKTESLSKNHDIADIWIYHQVNSKENAEDLDKRYVFEVKNQNDKDKDFTYQDELSITWDFNEFQSEEEQQLFIQVVQQTNRRKTYQNLQLKGSLKHQMQFFHGSDSLYIYLMLYYNKNLVYATKAYEIKGKSCTTILDKISAADLGLEAETIDTEKAKDILQTLKQDDEIELDQASVQKLTDSIIESTPTTTLEKVDYLDNLKTLGTKAEDSNISTKIKDAAESLIEDADLSILDDIAATYAEALKKEAKVKSDNQEGQEVNKEEEKKAMRKQAKQFADKLVNKLKDLLPDDQNVAIVNAEGFLAQLYRIINSARRILADDDYDFSTELFKGTKGVSKLTIPKDHEMVTKSEIVKLISYGEDFIDAPEANYYSPFVEVKFVDSNKEDVDFSKGDPITLQIAFFNTVESPESIKKEDIEFVYVKADGTTATDGITYVSHDENTATVEITHDGIFCMRGKVETEPEASEDVIDDDISYGQFIQLAIVALVLFLQ